MFRQIVQTLLLLLIACQPSPKPSTSFYYWKTNFQLSKEEQVALEINNVKRIYVRYFDVVLKGGVAVPESPIVFAERPKELVVVPVVYIKNEVMAQPNVDVNDLAKKVTLFIGGINKGNSIKASEIQIDCDWTEKSKVNYFNFLKRLQTETNLSISATIRLHQIKYRERTGVPPVQKGVLMYYNMGHISADASNSIYERTTANRYLDRLHEYPLSLDLALPLFAWALHIRDNEVIGLLRDVDAKTFLNDMHFEKRMDPYFEVKVSTFKSGHRFQKGDRIKVESISSDQLKEMSADLKQKLKLSPGEVIFYDLDKINLKQFENENHLFEKISADF